MLFRSDPDSSTGGAKKAGGLSLLGITGAMMTAGKLFKTLRGSVVIKGTTSDEFQNSHTMFQALQDVLQQILVSTGIEPKELRLKLTHSVDKASIKVGRTSCQVFYRIRLRGEAKNVAEAIVMSLQHTFSDKAQRQKFLDRFWELSTGYEWEDTLSQFHATVASSTSSPGQDDTSVSVAEVEAFLSQMDKDGKGTTGAGRSLASVVVKTLKAAGKPQLSLELFLEAMNNVVPTRRPRVIAYLKSIQEFCELVNSMHMDDMADFVNGEHVGDVEDIDPAWRSTLEKCYHMMDGDNSDTVTLAEMLTFFGQQHEADIARCFDGMDANRDRVVTIDEFVKSLGDATPVFHKLITDMVKSVDEIGAISTDDLEEFEIGRAHV